MRTSYTQRLIAGALATIMTTPAGVEHVIYPENHPHWKDKRKPNGGKKRFKQNRRFQMKHGFKAKYRKGRHNGR